MLAPSCREPRPLRARLGPLTVDVAVCDPLTLILSADFRFWLLTGDGSFGMRGGTATCLELSVQQQHPTQKLPPPSNRNQKSVVRTRELRGVRHNCTLLLPSLPIALLSRTGTGNIHLGNRHLGPEPEIENRESSSDVTQCRVAYTSSIGPPL